MNKLQVKNIDGTFEEWDLINAFKINEINKRFAFISNDELLQSAVFYATEFVETAPGVYSFIGLDDTLFNSAVRGALVDICSTAGEIAVDDLESISAKLTSEVNNLLNSNVFNISDSQKKVKQLRVPKEYTIPNDKGIIPIASQIWSKTAEEEIEMFDAFDAISKNNEDGVIETLDLPKLDNQSIETSQNIGASFPSTNKFTSELSNPMFSNDTIEQPPVSVEDFSSLSTFAPKEETSNAPVEQLPTEEKKFLDMEMPKMPEMVVKEPENVDNDLFEETVIPQIQKPVIQETSSSGIINFPETSNIVENVQGSINNGNAPEIIDIDKIINEKKDKLIHSILEQINDITANINTIFDELKEVLNEMYGKTIDSNQTPQQKVEDSLVGDSLVGDALASIDRIPTMEDTEEQFYGRAA